MMEQDQVCYHHYKLNIDPSEIREKFKDVKFLLVAGAPSRVEACARYFETEQMRALQNGSSVFHDIANDKKYQLECLTGAGSRFDLYKFGPVLMASHGIGSPSMSTAVHEALLMCREAGQLDKVTVIRFGTCGGVGVDPGTLCITTKAVDPLFRDYIEVPICGKMFIRKAIPDTMTANKLLEAGHQLAKLEALDAGQQYVALGGCTLSADDFYEEQGRTNGVICDHSLEDKYNYLITARDKGVINMEMEACYLMAMCHKLGVNAGIVCVALTNRLVTDRITVTHEQLEEFECRLFRLCRLFIKSCLHN